MLIVNAVILYFQLIVDAAFIYLSKLSTVQYISKR